MQITFFSSLSLSLSFNKHKQMSNSHILFEDIFDVKDIDKDGKKFDKVSRLECFGENYEMDLLIDINTDIYPMEVNDKFTFVLTSSLNLDGAPDEGVFDQSGKPSLLDKYEYAMYGKVFKYQEEKGPIPKVSIYVSFGGLLMRLKGDYRNLQSIETDSRVYCLIRKAAL